MDQAASKGLAKKLALVGVFLLAVLLLVGGEEDPGLIGRLGEATPANLAARQASEPAGSVPAPPPPPRRAPRQQESRSLSAWYAESVADGPAEPAPVAPAPLDESHLINDARPFVDAGPMIEAGIGFDEPAAPEPVELVE